MTDRHPSPAASATGDLGFTYRLCKNGNVEVRHHGKLASTLRGADAQDFTAKATRGDVADGQQLMARVTGNYKRGNERSAGNHSRNRR